MSVNFVAGQKSSSDYYPFGMAMPGREFSSSGYRYGFNGMENDNDVKGKGNQIDFGFRIYDPRIGKFQSIDLVLKNFIAESPYNFAGNNPIFYFDKEGKTKVTYLTIIHNGESATIKVVDKNFVKSVVDDSRYVGFFDGKKHDISHDHNVMENIVLNFDDPSKSSYSETDIGRTRSTAGEIAHYIGEGLKSFADWKGGTGGVEFYSINGQGQEKRIGEGDINSENIDDLLSGISGVKTTWEAEGNLLKLPKLTGALFQKVNAFTKKTGDLLDATEMASDLGDQLKLKTGKSTVRDSAICNTCDGTYSTKDTVKHNEDRQQVGGYKPK